MTRAVAPLPFSDTASAILDEAQALIQSRGYSGFSYNDISTALGITKASIHYHFASKEQLGVAVVTRYAQAFTGALGALAGNETVTTAALLDLYTQPYMQFADGCVQVCLCGALAGEIGALPETVRQRVADFFCWHQDWLARILERGARRGEVHLKAAATDVAAMAFGALQGALLLARTTGDPARFHAAASALRAQLVIGA